MSGENVYNNTFQLHGHHAHHPRVQDAKEFKVEDSKKLTEYAKKIKEMGLKDPWIRNYVWQYPTWYTGKFVMWNTVLRGFKWGFIAACITAAVHYSVDDFRVSRHFKNGDPVPDGHGHGHH